MTTIAPERSAPTDPAPRPGPSAWRTLAVVAIFAALFAALGYGISGLVAPRHVNLADPESWLPKQQLDHPVDRTLVGTVADPALTVEGDLVEVKTPTFSVLADVTGPLVPGEGFTYQTSFTTCTWTVSFTDVVGRVPIAIADFDTIDHTGAVFQPTLVPGQPAPPAFVTTGGHLSFQIRAVMPVGEGLMRWAPDGNNIVAKWDYQVEND